MTMLYALKAAAAAAWFVAAEFAFTGRYLLALAAVPSLLLIRHLTDARRRARRGDGP